MEKTGPVLNKEVSKVKQEWITLENKKVHLMLQCKTTLTLFSDQVENTSGNLTGHSIIPLQSIRRFGITSAREERTGAA